jgi:hypothetical protein
VGLFALIAVVWSQKETIEPQQKITKLAIGVPGGLALGDVEVETITSVRYERQARFLLVSDAPPKKNHQLLGLRCGCRSDTWTTAVRHRCHHVGSGAAALFVGNPVSSVGV